MSAGYARRMMLHMTARMRAYFPHVTIACAVLLAAALGAEEKAPTLADVVFQRANDRLDAGQTNEGLAGLAHALRLDSGHAGARQRLVSFLTHRTYALPVAEWSLPASDGSVDFSRDGERMVFISGKTAQLLETRTGRKIGSAMPCLGPTAFRADSRVLAVATTNRNVELVSTADGKPIRMEQRFEREIAGMEFLGNSETLALNIPLPGEAPAKRNHVFWDTHTGTLMESPFGRDVRIYFFGTTAGMGRVTLIGVHGKKEEHWAARMELDGWKKAAGPSLLQKGEEVSEISPDGDYAIISYGVGPLGGNGKSKKWDIATGELIEDKKNNEGWRAPTGPWHTVDQSRPGSSFAAHQKERVESWEKNGGQLPAGASELRSRVFGPDGQFSLGIYGDGTVTLEGLEDKTLPEVRHPWGEPDARFLRGGQEMVVVEPPSDENRARRVSVWQWRSGSAVTFWSSGQLGGNDVRFLPKSDKLFVLSESGEMSHWDALKGERLAGPVKFAENYQRPYRTGGFAKDTDFSADNGKFIAPVKDGAMRLFDTATMQPAGEQFSAPDGAGAILSTDGSLAAMWQKGDMAIFDPKTGKTLGRCMRTTEDQGDGLRPMSFDPSGRLLATSDGPIFDWRKNRRLSDPLGQATAYVFIPNTPLLAGVEASGGLHVHVPASVTFWNLESPRIKTGEGWAQGSHYEKSTATAFSADGKLALTCASSEEHQQNAIKLWRLPGMKPACEPIRVPSVIGAVTFSGDGKFFAALKCNPVNDACDVRVWETATGAPRTEWMYCGGADGLQFNHDNRLLLAHGWEGAWLYDLATDEDATSEDLIVLAEATAGLRVNPATLRAEPHDGFPALDELRRHQPDSWFFQPLDERTSGPHTKQHLPQLLHENITLHPRLEASHIAPLHTYAAATVVANNLRDTWAWNDIAALAEVALDRSHGTLLAFPSNADDDPWKAHLDFKAGAVDARAALGMEKSAQHLAKAGFYDWLEGDFNAAQAKYREACALENDRAYGWAMRALIHAELGEKEQSAEASAAAAKLGEHMVPVRCVLGWTKLILGEYDSAAEWLNPPKQDKEQEAQPRDPFSDNRLEWDCDERFWVREKALAEAVLARMDPLRHERSWKTESGPALIKRAADHLFFPFAIEDGALIFKRHRLSGNAKEAVESLIKEYRNWSKVQRQ